MKITVKPYRRRDGSIMFYLNNDRKVSVGISPEHGFQSSKATAGELKLWNAFCAATREAETIATCAEMSKHSEFHMRIFNGISFAMTDTANIGGVDVGSDGFFIVRDGRVMRPVFEIEA